MQGGLYFGVIVPRLKIIFILTAAMIVSFPLDRTISLYVASVRPAPLLPLVRVANNLTVVYLFIFILSILLIIAKRFDLLAVLLLSAVAASLAADLIKLLVGRARPFLVLPIIALEEISTFSFPSGHLALISALLAPIKKMSDEGYFVSFPVFNLFLAYLFLVAFSRLFAGVHFLSDLIGGTILGLAVGLFFVGLSERGSFKRGELGGGHLLALILFGAKLLLAKSP